MRLQPIVLALFSLLVFGVLSGCEKSVEFQVANEVCEHFADLSMNDFPGREDLSEEQVAAREEQLTDYCLEKVERGELITPKQAECMNEAASLEALAACRTDDPLL
jgi:nucleoid-associated protein YejK